MSRSGGARPGTSTLPVRDVLTLERPREPAGSEVRGALRLVFRTRGSVTYLADQFARAPFRIVRPFALEDGGILLQLTHVAPGMFAGDDYRLDVVVESGARVVLVGASATKVHRMPPSGVAAQTVACTVMAGGTLEYYPGLVIPFPGSAFVQAVEVTLSPRARFGMLELWAMGRIVRGEYLAFRRLCSRTRVVRDNRPCYLDALQLRADRSHPAGWGVLEGHRYIATGYWHWDSATSGELQADIAEPDLLLVSGAPSPGSLYVRGLARDGVELGAALSAFLRRQRAAWGLPPILFDRYTSTGNLYR